MRVTAFLKLSTVLLPLVLLASIWWVTSNLRHVDAEPANPAESMPYLTDHIEPSPATDETEAQTLGQDPALVEALELVDLANADHTATQVETSTAWASQLSPQLTRLEYANICKDRMGEVPAFDCTDGELIPITVNGVAQDKEVSNCDRPALLNGTCVPRSRLGTLDTGNPDVTTVFICRKYSGFNPNDDNFQDIAVIQHHRKTGETCWHQSPINVNNPGRDVPSPMDPNANQNHTYWKDLDGVAEDNCQACHDADPFILTPYVSQVLNPASPGVSPPGWNPKGPYNSNFQDVFRDPQFTTFEPEGNSCAACHRIGANTCRQVGRNLVHRSIDEGWMPPSGNANSEDIAQIERCCANPQLAECNARVPNACSNTIYVDRKHTGAEEGTATNPFRTIASAYDQVCEGGQLSVQSGLYLENVAFAKELSMLSRGGAATIGDTPYWRYVTPDSGGVVASSDGALRTTFPSGAVGQETLVEIQNTNTPPPSPQDLQHIGLAFDMTAQDGSGNSVTDFAQPFVLDLTYTDPAWQNAGISDEGSLNLYFWTSERWQAVLPCDGCTHDVGANTFRATLDHLTEFTVMGPQTPSQDTLLGDCSGDGRVAINDLLAFGEEYLDDDGNDPAQAGGGAFAGNRGCDANNDNLIAINDLLCIAMIYLGEPEACQAVASADSRQRLEAIGVELEAALGGGDEELEQFLHRLQLPVIQK